MNLRFVWRPHYGLLAAWIVTLLCTVSYLAIIEASKPKPIVMTAFSALAIAIVIYWIRGEPTQCEQSVADSGEDMVNARDLDPG